MDGRCAPSVSRKLYYGTIYTLMEPFAALVPSTYMNLSGRAVLEAAKLGFPTGRMLVLHDDKDLPLGAARLSLDGGAAGHNGVGSIFDELGTQSVPRLRLGIGPFRRPLGEWVLGEWGEDEWETIRGMDAPFSAFMSMLAGAQGVEEMRAKVNQEAFWKSACNGPDL
jgi:PTH1 family peptidyl-tRNA hydrolase